MLGNHRVPMVSPGKHFFLFLRPKKVPKMGFFVAGDPKNIILKIKKKSANFSNYFAPRFLPAISKIKNMSEMKHPTGPRRAGGRGVKAAPIYHHTGPLSSFPDRPLWHCHIGCNASPRLAPIEEHFSVACIVPQQRVW